MKDCKHKYTNTSEGNMVCRECFKELLTENPEHQKEYKKWESMRVQIAEDWIEIYKENIEKDKNQISIIRKQIKELQDGE